MLKKSTQQKINFADCNFIRTNIFKLWMPPYQRMHSPQARNSLLSALCLDTDSRFLGFLGTSNTLTFINSHLPINHSNVFFTLRMLIYESLKSNWGEKYWSDVNLIKTVQEEKNYLPKIIYLVLKKMVVCLLSHQQNHIRTGQDP